MTYFSLPLCALGNKDGETSRDTATPNPADTTRWMCASLERRTSPRTSVSRSCAGVPQDFRSRIGARQSQDFPRISQNKPQYNTAAFGHRPQDFPRLFQKEPQYNTASFGNLYDFDNITIFVYSNSIPPIFMSISNKEYFTPENGANTESAT